MILLHFPDSDSWVLKKEKENISVYTRKIITSDFKELKSRTTVKSSLSSIVQLVTDADHYTDWVYHCITATLIKKGSAEIYSYQLLDAPWPADDRDLVACARVKQDTKTKIVTVRSDAVNDLIPEKKDVVRIKKFHSRYILTPKGNGYVEIDYEMGTDPGGNIPAWLVNLVIVNGPFSTQKMMNALLQTSRYKSVTLDYIIEP